MRRDKNDNGPDSDNPGQTDAVSQGENRHQSVRGHDKRYREIHVHDDALNISREELVTAREDAVHLREDEVASRERDVLVAETAQAATDDHMLLLSREESATAREDAVHLREDEVTSRERDVLVTETAQAASDDHMLLLQQVNERLVIATIEAQQLTERLQAAKVQLESAKSLAEAANLSKSAFLSSMSHELRTPLNAILGFAQLLEAGTPTPTPTQIVRLQQIIKAGWYLLELINQILDLAKVESGQLTLSSEAVALSEVMHECEAMIEPEARQRGIHIRVHPSDCVASADRTRLKQVLINLLSNAIKYNRAQGTVEMKCSLSPPDRIRISIKDSGAGLPPEKLAQLFQPFNRLGQENGPEEGTGIGLVVTKQLVELMGGTVGVESTVGVGSEFWIELIGDKPPLAVDRAVPVEVAPHTQVSAALRTLLYVEDNPANLMLVEQIIEAQPQVLMLSARDAHLGIELARTHLPDVILMDINLPGINGYDALKILRADPATKHIPVIALSADAMQSEIEKGLAAGFFRYITKPIKVNAFMEALDQALKFAETGLDGAAGTPSQL